MIATARYRAYSAYSAYNAYRAYSAYSRPPLRKQWKQLS